ncbi:MAG: hypothetical protein JO202_05330 [Ktedonobacteraceae bacterium]|nr:hypothetical protein [Ktedonobacteraceae bacterium]
MRNTHTIITSKYSFVLCFLILSTLLSACDLAASLSNGNQDHTTTLTINSAQSITYSTSPQAILIRTFYGGGLYGSLELSPTTSIYGDGTFILGTEQTGKVDSNTLQQLLQTLLDTDGLLNLKRHQFVDIQDQNAMFLELMLNGKQEEFVYGSFGNQQESTQDMAEYHRLGQAITTINETLKGPTHSYKASAFALLTRQIFNADPAQTIAWPLADFTLVQATDSECGPLPPDDTSPNKETSCLKYTIPHSAILLAPAQLESLRGQLNGQQQGFFTEGGLYYSITLRPLLPDELAQKMLAMFGSNQSTFNAVPLITGAVPATSTATPAG